MSSARVSSGPTLGYTERAASALKTGTAAAAAAGFTVGSTIAYVAPHMAGAIDVIVVKQPDGSLKSSPFYVRFGKYSHLRAPNKGVQISVNDIKVDFTMHVGRTGEAYFIEEKDDGADAGAPEDDYLAGAMSPLSGYSSGEDSAFSRFPRGHTGASPDQSAFGDRLQHLKHHERSQDGSGVEGPSASNTPARTLSFSSTALIPGQGLRTVGSAPATPSLLSPLPGASPPEKAFSQPTPLPKAEPPAQSPSVTSQNPVPSASPRPPEITNGQGPSRSTSGSPKILRGFEAKDTVEASQHRPASPATTPASILTADLVAAAASAAADLGAGSTGMAKNIAKAVASPAEGCAELSKEVNNVSENVASEGKPPAADGVAGPQDEVQSPRLTANGKAVPWSSALPIGAQVDGGGRASPLISRPLSPESLRDSDGDAASPTGSIEDASLWRQASASRPPTHPWSVGQPRLLPTPLATQALPAVVTAADAAKPVKGPRDDSTPSAITAIPKAPPGIGTEKAGNRMELEAEDELINMEGDAAPYAMYEAHRERQEWENGGALPVVEDPSYAVIAEKQDQAAEAASPNGANHSGGTSSPGVVSPFATPTSPAPASSPRSLRSEAETRDSAVMSSREQPEKSQLPIGSPANEVGPETAPAALITSASSTGSIRVPSSSPRASQAVDQASASPEPRAGPDMGDRLSGVSPSDGGYWADSERQTPLATEASFSSVGGGPKQASTVPWEGLGGFALSMCGDSLREGMSPEEAADVFDAHLVNRTQFAESSSQMMSSADLVCRVGNVLYPWKVAAPVILGMLAFGGSWEALLPEGMPGIRVPAPPESLAGEDGTNAKKAPRMEDLTTAQRSSWRLWLGSWRTASLSMSRKDEAGRMRPSGMPRSSSLQDLLMPPPKTLKRRNFVPTADQLASLPLNDGQNTIDFTFGKTRLRAYVYYLQWNTRLIISDVDGTITRSDILGHVLPRVGLDWSHYGINKLFTNIRANGYEIMFLSSRAIAQASATRDYLHTLTQNGDTLPPGPVIISPDGLMPSLYRELVLRRPHEFKIRALEDIRALFPSHWNPFYAGFGNRDTDEISYLTVGVPPSKIFIINPRGELRKASSSVDTSTWHTLIGVNELVDKVFPPIVTKGDEDIPEREEFNDYNYWHTTPAMIVESDDEFFEDSLAGNDIEETSDEYESAEEEVASYWRP